jgi:hypothetical protein
MIRVLILCSLLIPSLVVAESYKQLGWQVLQCIGHDYRASSIP